MGTSASLAFIPKAPIIGETAVQRVWVKWDGDFQTKFSTGWKLVMFYNDIVSAACVCASDQWSVGRVFPGAYKYILGEPDFKKTRVIEDEYLSSLHMYSYSYTYVGEVFGKITRTGWWVFVSDYSYETVHEESDWVIKHEHGWLIHLESYYLNFAGAPSITSLVLYKTTPAEYSPYTPKVKKRIKAVFPELLSEVGMTFPAFTKTLQDAATYFETDSLVLTELLANVRVTKEFSM
jgi:hypothetical protein